MRKASYAGQFYPATKKEIQEEIKKFKQAKTKTEVKLMIVPHAGYTYCGQTANLTYSSVKDDFDIIILLGTDHTGSGTCLSLEDFSTPLGIVKNDKEITEELLKTIKLNDLAHQQEHSLEVQLPFIQTYFKKAKLVPVIVGTSTQQTYEDIAKTIFKIIDQHHKKILVLVSSDLTHYGEIYNFTPFQDGKKIKQLDKKIIDKILDLNLKGFLKETEKTTVCGQAPIAVCIELTKLLDIKNPKLIDYSTSADVSGDWNTVVGYAGIIFS